MFLIKGPHTLSKLSIILPQPNFEASVVISIVGQSMVIALNAVGRLVTHQWRSLIDPRDSAMFALFLVFTHVTLVLDNRR